MKKQSSSKTKRAHPKKSSYVGSSSDESDVEEIKVPKKSKTSPAKTSNANAKKPNAFIESDEENPQKNQLPKKVSVPPKSKSTPPKMCQKCKVQIVSWKCKSMECAQKKRIYLCGVCDQMCHKAPSTMDHEREQIWGLALTHTHFQELLFFRLSRKYFLNQSDYTSLNSRFLNI